MMPDRQLLQSLESAQLSPEQFDHRAHLRVAWILLDVESDLDQAHHRFKQALVNFLKAHSVDPAKYHETITCAWIKAVQYFRKKSPAVADSIEFLESHPQLHDPEIMLTHYRPETLFSEPARQRFVEPDLQPIPPDG